MNPRRKRTTSAERGGTKTLVANYFDRMRCRLHDSEPIRGVLPENSRRWLARESDALPDFLAAPWGGAPAAGPPLFLPGQELDSKRRLEFCSGVFA
jgi:hypothetical protein